jgi:epoxyqueuosine reductase
MNLNKKICYDAVKCDQYFTSMKNKGQLPVCGLCLYICPYGRNKGVKT